MANGDCLLELYKLHAELADRVSQRREGANRLFVSVLTGLLVFLAWALRFGADDLSLTTVLVFFGFAGALLSAAWFVVIRSYRQLNTGKYRALRELEKQLPYRFFSREWKLLKKGGGFRRYWKLTDVETSLPAVFFALFLGILTFSAIR